MESPTIRVVRPGATTETRVARAIRLAAEAQKASRAVADGLLEDLASNAEECSEAAGLTSIPHGVRDELRQLGDHIAARLQAIQSIATRTS